jgi:hypothetical protein
MVSGTGTNDVTTVPERRSEHGTQMSFVQVGMSARPADATTHF